LLHVKEPNRVLFRKKRSMSLSKNEIKVIQSLQRKKGRIQHRMFFAEGIKVVQELIASSFELSSLYVTKECQDCFDSEQHTLITEGALKKISALKTPSGVLAVFRIADVQELQLDGLVLALDNINDPGNLGTIIRLCDWFGVQQLLCSKDTVDCYNSKVVQATMGSLSRVQINYVNLKEVLEASPSPILVADLDGENLYQTSLPEKAVLVLGNESNGISAELKGLKDRLLTIPRFGSDTESLNVATAAAVILSEFRRNQ
jgi:TrmH family RNA methyltransferase